MLGWFKRKFGKKKTVEESPPQPELSEDLEVVEQEAESQQAIESLEKVAPEETEEPAPDSIAEPSDEKEKDQEQVDVSSEPDESPADRTVADEFSHVVEQEQTEDAELDEGEPSAEIVQEDLPEAVVEEQELAGEEQNDIIPETVFEQDERVELKQDITETETSPDTHELLAGQSDVAVEADEVSSADAETLHQVKQETTTVGESPLPEAEDWQDAEDLDDAAGSMAEGDEPTIDSLPQAEEQASQDPGESAAVTAPTVEKPQSRSFFKRLQERLGKTRDSLVYRLDSLFLGKKEIDQDLFDELEEILITADLGVDTTFDLLDHARKVVSRDKLSDPQSLKAVIQDRILSYIQASDQPAEMVMPEEGPFVIMVVGVNGVGKTTTIGKVASKFKRSGQSVLLVAGDTFRAAAIDQLKIWGERVGVEVIAQNPGADPSSVVFDAMEYGIAHEYDVVLIDTAGRLHTSVNLMEELKKIKRVIGKKLEGAPHEVMLVLDATTGQNGLSQVKLFSEAVDVSGLAMTKLDGTAKGGIVANVCREMKIPVRFIGIGEQIDDLRDFDSREFVEALFTNESPA